ncbi:unnamed protein product [Thelazia callipaeda]|uniref:Uncharacterized protein n=1 Tax=Thelazia callipaeda TaxID=103827 RepID=A0A3P7L1B7_THECL|nr:unnamed protein product [Thelazia callipaeda]
MNDHFYKFYDELFCSNGERYVASDERLGPVGSESETSSQAQYDTNSQTSVPTRFYTYSTLPTSSYKVSATVGPISESNSAIDVRQLETSSSMPKLPLKKVSSFPDPPPNFILNKEMAIEYDKNGRRHYIPKDISRSASRDIHEDIDLVAKSHSNVNGDDDTLNAELCPRRSSSGTNILYNIRRVELARGAQPSVRLLAKAFETMESNTSKGSSNSKRSLFGIRKSRSVETTETAKDSVVKSVLPPGTPGHVAVTVLGRNTSLSQIEELMGSQSPFGTIPRGSRNLFRNMGTKLIERVRRSLSRSNSKCRSRDLSVESNRSGQKNCEKQNAELLPDSTGNIAKNEAMKF